MKQNIVAFFLLSIGYTGFSQELSFDVHGTTPHPIKKAVLHEAKTMSDINPGYPSSWITDYVSAEILSSNNGKVLKAVGVNNVLSTEQQNMLRSTDLGADVVITVKYNTRNSVTQAIELNSLIYSVTVVPEIEAEYHGGKNLLKQYLQENAIQKLKVPDPKLFQQTLVRFTVNENGEIANVQISKSSNDPKTDQVLLEAIQNMPKWKPAEDAKGVKVKQVFEFGVGNAGC